MKPTVPSVVGVKIGALVRWPRLNNFFPPYDLYFLAKAELSASRVKITEALHNRKKDGADAGPARRILYLVCLCHLADTPT